MSPVVNRRTLLKTTGVSLALSGILPQAAKRAVAQTGPSLEKYVQPLPIPDVREPDGTRDGADYYEIPLVEFSTKLHPDLPETTLWGYDGQYPGPFIRSRRNQRIEVRFDNSNLPDEHLLPVDKRINGTKPSDYPEYDGPVPDVRTVTHFHGLTIEPESDGQAEMWVSPDGTTGPRFVNHVHDVPNRQSRMTSVYHDHTLGISRLNNYAGLVGLYAIASQAEARLDLPSGAYDVPLLIQDRAFDDDGSLHYPETFSPNVAGDTAVVNGAVWPYFDVEPRRYRLRLANGSNGRAYNLRLENDDGGSVPTLYQFAADHGFLEDVVPIGPDEDLDSLLLTVFERAEVLVDFSDHAGETFTVTNDAAFPFAGPEAHDEDGNHETVDGHSGDNMDDGHGGSGPHLGEIMQIRVAESSDEVADESADPKTLELPPQTGPDANAAKTTRDVTMTMTQDEYGLPKHVLNNRGFRDETVIKPQLGTTEIWNVENKTVHTHPLHLHLVQFDVLGRGPDGTHSPAANERVGKDTVRVDPGETVRILVTFDSFTGQYPFHCHVLEHEDHEMMRPFEVVAGNSGENNGANR